MQKFLISPHLESKKKLINTKDNFAIKNNLDLSKEGDRIVFYN